MSKSSWIAVMIVFAAVAAPLVRGDDVSRAPGVMVRLYDIGEAMRGLPSIARGELPNVVRVIPTIDLQSANGAFDPLQDNFMTEVLGFVHITDSGTYTFRLLSDDGAMLWIDGGLVVDHDGLHGPDPKDGAIDLTAGEHRLRILHFEAGGGEALSLQWQTPGMGDDADFALLPHDVLTHDTATLKTTSPGQKRVIMPLRRGLPGDGSTLTVMHPSFVGHPAQIDVGSSPREWQGMDTCIRIGATGDSRTPAILLPSATGAPQSVWHIPLRMTPTSWADDMLTSPQSKTDPCLVPRVAAIQGQSELWRTVPDDLDNVIQGAAFRFMAGLPNRISGLLLLDDIAAFIVDSTSDGADPRAIRWIIRPNDRVTFEMAAVRAMTNGLEIEFTKPLDVRIGWEADSYYVEQWPFDLETGQSPYRDGVRYPVEAASVSRDRKRVFLQMDSLKTSHLVYLRLLPPCLSEDGDLPWTTEAWYTLNVIPKDRPGKRLPGPSMRPRNYLTAQEKAAGWRLLFDGRTTKGWKSYGKNESPSGWQIKEGCLVRVGSGGDIMTDEQFDDFELTIDWRISAGGNSGIFYRVDGERSYPWQTGPEMQVLDNREHIDGRNAKTSAGSNYALHAPVRDVTEPVGLFNRARILVQGHHVEHWLNGVKVVEYELDSPEWTGLVADSKFASMPHYGRTPKGHLVLQDHGDKVWYMNIKIRAIEASHLQVE